VTGEPAAEPTPPDEPTAHKPTPRGEPSPPAQPTARDAKRSGEPTARPATPSGEPTVHHATPSGEPTVHHATPSGEPTLVIGVTGPIGCGKSTVAAWLGELGATTVDADLVARQVVERGEPALDQVLQEFGPEVAAPDGSLDRAALGRIVFTDPDALARLEAIVHPAVRPRILERIAVATRDGAPAAVVEAIKLVEGGLAAICDEVWLVLCDATAQRDRLIARGADAADMDARIAAQSDIVDRLLPAATRVIDTSGTVDETRAAVEVAWRAAFSGSDEDDPARRV
jgi:dephospho-CoA kinase